MKDIALKSNEFVTDVCSGLGFDVEVATIVDDEGIRVDFSGEDAGMFLAESGELLDSFETLLFQIWGRELDKSHRFVCDAGGFRQTRIRELHAMAKFAVQQVRGKGLPFTFGKLTSFERRIVHMALQAESDVVSESVGEGRDRRLQVSIK